MDIDLLAKMVKEVVMDHDAVTLPGVGSFVAEWVPSTFADRGYTILPPYRKLYFSPKQGEDTLLAQLYARSNDISLADATRILTDFLSEMKEVLKVKKTIIFPGLGRLRATMENHFFFVADEDLDIYPEGFGLQPLSLKTHEETQEEVAQAVASLATLLQKESESQPEAEWPRNQPRSPKPPRSRNLSRSPNRSPNRSRNPNRNPGPNRSRKPSPSRNRRKRYVKPKRPAGALSGPSYWSLWCWLFWQLSPWWWPASLPPSGWTASFTARKSMNFFIISSVK